MKYQVKKRFYLIKIGLLLLTALCAKVHAGDKFWQDKLLNKLPQLNTSTVAFATILHSIDTRSCYDWLASMNKGNARRMGNCLIAQLWKMVWLRIVYVVLQDTILFRYALLSKLVIDILAQLVRNTKIARMLSYWSLGLAVGHCYVLLNQQNLSWSKVYFTFLLVFCIYYSVSVLRQKYQEYLAKKALGFGKKTKNSKNDLTFIYHLFSYTFLSNLVGAACAFAPSMLSKFVPLLKYWQEWVLIYFPFVIFVLEYFSIKSEIGFMPYG